jgi:hypothetical protein
MVVMLRRLGERGSLTIGADPELTVPWGFASVRGLDNRGLAARSADGWTYQITSLGRSWLRQHP